MTQKDMMILAVLAVGGFLAYQHLNKVPMVSENNTLSVHSAGRADTPPPAAPQIANTTGGPGVAQQKLGTLGSIIDQSKTLFGGGSFF